jgi:hypothetical protein
MGYIYLVTNKVNGKQYIGQSVCKDYVITKLVINQYINIHLNLYELIG